jgi:hypothetical protein
MGACCLDGVHEVFLLILGRLPDSVILQAWIRSEVQVGIAVRFVLCNAIPGAVTSPLRRMQLPLHGGWVWFSEVW